MSTLRSLSVFRLSASRSLTFFHYTFLIYKSTILRSVLVSRQFIKNIYFSLLSCAVGSGGDDSNSHSLSLSLSEYIFHEENCVKIKIVWTAAPFVLHYLSLWDFRLFTFSYFTFSLRGIQLRSRCWSDYNIHTGDRMFLSEREYLRLKFVRIIIEALKKQWW